MKNTWVYDIETLKSCFTYVAINIDTLEIKKYVIHKNRNEFPQFVKHLSEDVKGMIGFNNIGFDYPVLFNLLGPHFENAFSIIKENVDPVEIIDLIYTTAQDVIAEQKQKHYNPESIVNISKKQCTIPQLDLFLLWHFNNKARMTSLKSLEISMNYPNVMDMPIHHDTPDITEAQIKEILEYNVNDVLATFEFYKRSKSKIDLRKELSKQYDIQCLNFPDSKIGESLVLKLYCEATDSNPWEIKKLRTTYSKINIKDCIFDYISFNTKPFQKLLSTLQSKIIVETKGAITESVIHKGFKYDYGTGGIHGCIKSGVYRADENYVIIDADVASLYPSIAIVNKLYPKHLGEIFCEVYEEGIVKPRLAAKKAGNMVIADGFKLSANSVYGKSNDKYSFLQDPMYTMKTTLNGQLMLSMLCEDIMENIPDVIMLQVNTDGFTVKIHKDFVEQYYNYCKTWEEKTKLVLEYIDYSMMIIGDVNNYIAVKTNGDCKYKGRFEIEKDYHKDNSFKIVPIALSNYFIHGIPIEETILNHDNIYDFCGRQKFKGNDFGETHSLVDDNINIIKQQKNTRYYVSANGATFIKQYAKGSREFIHVGYKVTIFNTYYKTDFKNYNINYQFYVNQCNKEIRNIIDNQLALF